MNRISATLPTFLLKLLFLPISIYIGSTAFVFAAEDILSKITQTPNIKLVEQCVAKVNQYPDDALDASARLYQTSICYLCADCDLEADNGRLFGLHMPRNNVLEAEPSTNIVLGDTYRTAYTLMQQAAELGDIKANYALAALIYANNLDEKKLTKKQIAYQKVKDLIAKVDDKGRQHEKDEIYDAHKLVMQEAYTKSHERDFNAEIHVRLLNAAREGHMPAQFALSEVYSRGIGVALDKVHAYAWVATAVAQNPPFGSGRRDSHAASMNFFELNEAESLAEEFMKKHTDIFDRSSMTVMR